MSDLTSKLSDRVEDAVGGVSRVADEPVKSPRTAVVIGRMLALAFLVCFFTGLYSNVLQDPLPGQPFFPRPIWLYRATQGLHVISGTAAIPLLLAKLWTVYPKLFDWPPVRSVGHFLERASIAVLVGASLAEVSIGLLNIFQWYVFPFSFRLTHFALAWIIIGSLAIHIGVKLPLIVTNWRKRRSVDASSVVEGPGIDEPDASVVATVRQAAVHGNVEPPTTTRLSRRAFVGTVSVSVAAVTLLTAGQSIPALSPFTLFSPRRMNIGPQGLPINRTAMQAGVTAIAKSPEWVLTIAHRDRTTTFSRVDLLALPQTRATLPIACVEGWSQSADWVGVRMKDLLSAAGAPAGDLVVHSMQQRGPFATTQMPREFVEDPLTLVALSVNGETLDIEHGYPARVIAPGRPGVLQTKWLSLIEVSA